jgi:Protein of unknown function (DUF1569)
MPSLRDETVRNKIIERLLRLTPATKPSWGSLDAPRLVCHLRDGLAMSLGELSVRSVNRKAFQHFPLKHLMLYVLPFPKNVPTAPELLSSTPQSFDADRQQVVQMIHRLAATPKANGPEHPFFGPLSFEEWNALQWKHFVHHLNQFGC